MFGRSLCKEDVIHGLALFYQYQNSCPAVGAVRETIRRLQAVREWFERQTTYHFYSSSVIVVYGAEGGADTPVRVKMADFAHVFPAEGVRDESVLFGVSNLVRHLEGLLSAEYVFKDVRGGGCVPEPQVSTWKRRC